MVILFLSLHKRETGQFWNYFSKNGADLIIILKKGAVLAFLPSFETNGKQRSIVQLSIV